MATRSRTPAQRHVSMRPGVSTEAFTPVPFVRLDHDDPALLAELLDCVAEVASAGAFTLGEHVEAFERDFAAYCGSRFAIGVSSGTAALTLALRALRVGPGDEVVVPANSFIATAEAVSAVGATPRLVDVDSVTGLIDADILACALTPRVRCVIPVHLYGATVDLDPLLALAAEAGIWVIEDACQAHGAIYRGPTHPRVGTLGTLGAFSFYPAKNLGAWGDGGAVVTDDPQLAERVQLLRSHGERPRYRHRTIGATARLDALQAAILRRKLPHLDGWNAQRRRLAGMLREGLGLDAPDVADHVHHLFVIESPAREVLRAHLAARGVATGVHYPTPIHLTEAYCHLGQGAGSLPVCEERAQRICSLPLFPGMTDEECRRVIDGVRSFAQAQSDCSR